MKRRRWTKKETEYLVNNIGHIPYAAMAKHLGISVTRLSRKADRMGIGNPRRYCDLLNANEFAQALGISRRVINNWNDIHGFPVHRRVLKAEREYCLVCIDEFWTWAEKHKRLLDTRKFEKNLLGAEPLWMKDKRLEDLKRPVKEKKPWTTKEEELLIKLYKAGRSKALLAERFGRNECSIQRKVSKLRKQGRLPVKLSDNSNNQHDIPLEKRIS